jgi:hypothetical protein
MWLVWLIELAAFPSVNADGNLGRGVNLEVNQITEELNSNFMDLALKLKFPVPFE